MLQIFTEEDETRKAFQQLKHQQAKSHNDLHKQFQRHKKILAELTGIYDGISQEENSFISILV